MQEERESTKKYKGSRPFNTIRKRIDRASEMIDIDWNDPVERLKTILLLQFLEADSYYNKE